MMYLTIISIISIIVAFLSLRFSAKNNKDVCEMYERHIKRLEKGMESDKEVIKILDKLLEEQKG